MGRTVSTMVTAWMLEVDRHWSLGVVVEPCVAASQPLTEPSITPETKYFCRNG